MVEKPSKFTPKDEQYVVGPDHVVEDTAVVLTDSATITWDFSSPGLVTGTATDVRAVRFDAAQSLSGGQQSQARSNIGLGDSATRNVGTSAGTVAAGDDSRVTNALQPALNVNLTGGATASSYSGGTLTGSNQTFTPAPLNGSFQHVTLNGSSLTGTWTFAVPSSACASLIVEVVNGGSGAVAATISTSGYAKVVGSWASTNGYKYQFVAIRSNSGSTLTIQPMQ